MGTGRRARWVEGNSWVNDTHDTGDGTDQMKTQMPISKQIQRRYNGDAVIYMSGLQLYTLLLVYISLRALRRLTFFVLCHVC